MKHKIASQKIVAFFCLVLLLANSTGVVFATGIPAPPAAGSTFDQRLAQRKAEQNEQLNAQTQQHITAICAQQQAGIRRLQGKATTMSNNRTSTYQKIDGTLLITIGQLKLDLLDTFTLEQDRSTLAQKIATFETTTSNYGQTLGDLLTINCQADPAGYQALLDTARYYFSQLGPQSANISSYIANTVQPILQTFATQLQPKVNTNAGN